MQDELDRSKSELKMDNVPAPYYIEYRLSDVAEYDAEAAFGALRQDQHADRKADALSAAGEKAEQHERVVVRVGGGADAATGMVRRRIDAEYVIGRHQIRIAEALGRLCVVADDRRSGADVDYRK